MIIIFSPLDPTFQIALITILIPNILLICYVIFIIIQVMHHSVLEGLEVDDINYIN